MLFMEVYRFTCPKFEKMRSKNPKLCPFTEFFLPFFGYTARMHLFSKISPEIFF